MSMRSWKRRPACTGVALVLCLALAVSGCSNVDQIAHGRQFTPEGTLLVASLQPSCACMSVSNRAGRDLYLESSFYGVSRGSLLLKPGEVTRFLFDWAGPANADAYAINAFDVNGAGEPLRNARLRIQDVLHEAAPLMDTACDADECAFGSLALNRELERAAAHERELARRGVNYTSVIELSAPQDKCGCTMLSNFTDQTVVLRATLHGVETGQIDLPGGATVPVAFDWAGALDSDVYILDAVGVRASAAPASEPLPQAGNHRLAMTTRLKDYVEIDGSLVDMQCTDAGASFMSRRTPNDPLEPIFSCAWTPGGGPGLGMRVAFDQRANALQNDAVTPPATVFPQPPVRR